MPARLSRRKIARYVAAQVVAGASLKQVLREIAAYLVETGQTRDYELLVRDIEDALARVGVVIADITTAHEGETVAETVLKSLAPHAKQIITRQHTDPDMLGGVLVEFPGTQCDASLRGRLQKLRSLEG